MENWLQTPLIVIVILTVVGAVFGIGKWVGNVNSDRTWFRSTVNSIKEEVGKIQDNVNEILWFVSGGALSRNSPLHLTEFGRKISKDLGARDWAGNLCRSGQLKKETHGMSFEEVEEFCVNFVLSRLNPTDQERRNLEGCARDNGVTSLVVRRVLAIELRDELLKSSASL